MTKTIKHFGEMTKTNSCSEISCRKEGKDSREKLMRERICKVVNNKNPHDDDGNNNNRTLWTENFLTKKERIREKESVRS